MTWVIGKAIFSVETFQENWQMKFFFELHKN